MMIAAFGGIFLSAFVPMLEARLFPVVGPLTITAVTRTPDGRTAVMAHFMKYRACPAVSRSWLALDPKLGWRRVHYNYRGDKMLASKPPGQSSYDEPVVLSLAWDARQVYALEKVIHRCHPFWDIPTTQFSGKLP
jgi:hypothetical protein